MRLDKFTVRNLELVEGMGDEGKSLLDVIDRTISPMGARLLRRWLLFPLKDVKAINARLDVVEYFFRHPEQHDEVKSLLEHVGDMERIISRWPWGAYRRVRWCSCAMRSMSWNRSKSCVAMPTLKRYVRSASSSIPVH